MPVRNALVSGRRLTAAAALVAALLALFATPAVAVKVHPFLGKIDLPDLPGDQSSPGGIAVDQSTHHLYVVDGIHHVIYDFGPDGKLNPTHPQLTGAPGFQPYGLAVDNSGGPNDGYIYAVSFSQGVQQFDSSGVATPVRIEASAIPPDGTPQGGGLPAVVNNGQFSPYGIAVDANGKIYVSDDRNEAIDEFSASGEFIAQVGAGLVNANAIAVGPGGDIYLATGGQGLKELDASGNCVNACAPLDPAYAGGVAVDAAGNVLVTATRGAGESSVNEYDPAGNLISNSGAEQLNRGGQIALDEDSGKIYVGDVAEFIHGPEIKPDVKVFGALLTFPDAITGTATLSGQSVTFSGEVGADGGPDATCVFQYADEAAFLESGFEDAVEVPCDPAGPFTGTGMSAVGAEAPELSGGTTYRYRLLATSSAGSTPGSVGEFSIPGPSIHAQSFGDLSQTGATLRAKINPNGKDTTYLFQYVSEAQFGQSGYAEAIAVPLGGEAIGAGNQDVEVAQPITGLAPGVAYRFRVVASNELGVARGPDTSFTTYTPSSPGLPDGRAYEQVSPLDKNGANVEGGTNAVQAAPDGNAITFFAAGGLPGGEGAAGLPVYLASRGAASWSTQSFSPPAATGPRGKTLGWSEDLRWAFNGNYFPGEPGAFYARESSSRASVKVAGGLAGADGGLSSFAAAAGSDSSAVAFEDTAQLLPGAIAEKPNLYLWDRESKQLLLGGVLNSGLAPSEGAFAGPYDWFGSIQGEGGATSKYYTQASHVLSADASRLFFTSAADKQLYVRINPLAPQSPLDPQGNCTDPAKACTLQVSKSQAAVPDPTEQPAAFAEATPDGRYVFFMSAGRLTDDATATAGRQLYRYDTVTQELVDLTVDTSGSESGADVLGVLGMSVDGSHVYFAANGVLAPGATAGSCKNGSGGLCSIYAWHDGATTLISRVSSAGSSIGESDAANWIPTPETPPIAREKASRVDPAGKVLLFRSKLPLTGYDNNGRDQLYRAELTSGGRTLQCVSCNPTGAPAGGDASLQAFPPKLASPKGQAPVLTHNLSLGGGRIFFDSPEQLVAGDTNGVNDVYEWEANGTGSCRSEDQNGGCLYLLSGGTDPQPSYFADAGANGDDAFFFTYGRLVGQDKDELQRRL